MSLHFENTNSSVVAPGSRWLRIMGGLRESQRRALDRGKPLVDGVSQQEGQVHLVPN